MLAPLTGPQGKTVCWESRPGTRTQEPRSPLQPQPFPNNATRGLNITQSLKLYFAAISAEEGDTAVYLDTAAPLSCSQPVALSRS